MEIGGWGGVGAGGEGEVVRADGDGYNCCSLLYTMAKHDIIGIHILGSGMDLSVIITSVQKAAFPGFRPDAGSGEERSDPKSPKSSPVSIVQELTIQSR